jgi:RHH-type proline utilization regulon transcriptional repressor/proline dehydrogenase/delta 1-pyrroline-5-carboxylate dehydrogenase
MITNKPLSTTNPLRDTIINAYRMDESECLAKLIPEATLPADVRAQVLETAGQLVVATREYKKQQSHIDALLHQYDLSTEEGISLMCLAEALLRIPDKKTMDMFISDKLSNADWKSHLDRENPFVINAATVSLLMTGSVYAPTLNNSEGLYASLKRTVSRLGAAVIRPIILQMMKSIGAQFVMGQDIDAAIKRAVEFENEGYRFSYDMLGEAARTEEDAKTYYDSYVTAIDAIGKAAVKGTPAQNPGISIKLSALHPRYEYGKYEQVMAELPPMLLTLAKQAKQYNIGLTVDAEEADRLDLSLDIFEKVFADPALNGWEGFGLAVQAYQKRASFVIDWLADLSKRHNKQIMVRLVKGAYWDAEIKVTQVQGFEGYPVFTRKNSTDVSYLACARKLLAQPQCFYPQFGTHNAYSVAAIMQIAGDNANFEFQCLHGMGAPLYHQVVDATKFNRPTRIYAPVGTHRDLLGYLVRRLLENGANSSFVNKLADDKTPVDKIVYDPTERINALASKPHPLIPQPRDIYGKWSNSDGLDLSNDHVLRTLKTEMDEVIANASHWVACPIINGDERRGQNLEPRFSPNNQSESIGRVSKAEELEVEEALKVATAANATWSNTPVEERAAILERAADGFQKAMPELMAILNREAGKSILDSMSEVRETIDYCRYYAHRAREDMTPHELPGPTGESNMLVLHARGTMACISPWNFPLAIFAGQVVAALATGNTVLAKPAEQTPYIAFRAVQILHEAGIPKSALQLMIGRGSVVGAKMVNDERVAGVMFTGSTETAKFIERSLANRKGQIAILVAETGGQNAMIVDSSALAEQTVADVVMSAFNSAGQRCSALRVLFVQDDIAPKIMTMLKGYMAEFTVGDPGWLANDIGPVIDNASKQMLEAHYAKMMATGKLIAQIPVKDTPNGHYFTPSAFEIDSLDQLEGEVFGPILHIIQYKSGELDKVMDAIINTGYGLTLGIHSRIDAVTQYVASRMPVGNIYINRNMIGAVVGVQPFGGERLSGTGPKAGGPHYLPRLCVERTISTNTTAVGGNARLVSLLEED